MPSAFIICHSERSEESRRGRCFRLLPPALSERSESNGSLALRIPRSEFRTPRCHLKESLAKPPGRP